MDQPGGAVLTCVPLARSFVSKLWFPTGIETANVAAGPADRRAVTTSTVAVHAVVEVLSFTVGSPRYLAIGLSGGPARTLDPRLHGCP
jgi:hypothetical protein